METPEEGTLKVVKAVVISPVSASADAKVRSPQVSTLHLMLPYAPPVVLICRPWYWMTESTFSASLGPKKFISGVSAYSTPSYFASLVFVVSGSESRSRGMKQRETARCVVLTGKPLCQRRSSVPMGSPTQDRGSASIAFGGVVPLRLWGRLDAKYLESK